MTLKGFRVSLNGWTVRSDAKRVSFFVTIENTRYPEVKFVIKLVSTLPMGSAAMKLLLSCSPLKYHRSVPALPSHRKV